MVGGLAAISFSSNCQRQDYVISDKIYYVLFDCTSGQKVVHCIRWLVYFRGQLISLLYLVLTDIIYSRRMKETKIFNKHHCLYAGCKIIRQCVWGIYYR